VKKRADEARSEGGTVEEAEAKREGQRAENKRKADEAEAQRVRDCRGGSQKEGEYIVLFHRFFRLDRRCFGRGP